MTCRDVVEFLDAWLDGSLPTRKRLVFLSHLAVCRDCRRYLDGYQKAVALGRRVFGAPDSVVSDDIPEELVDAILAARES